MSDKLENKQSNASDFIKITFHRHSPLEALHQDFIESCLRHKSEMVVYEAACAIIRLKQSQGTREIQSSISVLSVFLSSPKAVLKYAAAKTLSRVSISLNSVCILLK